VRIAHAVKKVTPACVLDRHRSCSPASPTSPSSARTDRLFAWFKERGSDVVITAERGDNGITRNGVEDMCRIA